MKYVLDSSVAFKWLVPEVDSDNAVLLRDGYANGTYDLIAPEIFPTEVTHALTRAERKGRVTATRGSQLFHDLLQVLPVLEADLLLLPRAYEISSAARIGVYDCLYVALAERESCELITADAKLILNLASQFPFIVALDSFH